VSPAQGGGRGTCSSKSTTAVNRGGDVVWGGDEGRGRIVVPYLMKPVISLPIMFACGFLRLGI